MPTVDRMTLIAVVLPEFVPNSHGVVTFVTTLRLPDERPVPAVTLLTTFHCDLVGIYKQVLPDLLLFVPLLMPVVIDSPNGLLALKFIVMTAVSDLPLLLTV